MGTNMRPNPISEWWDNQLTRPNCSELNEFHFPSDGLDPHILDDMLKRSLANMASAQRELDVCTVMTRRKKRRLIRNVTINKDGHNDNNQPTLGVQPMIASANHETGMRNVMEKDMVASTHSAPEISNVISENSIQDIHNETDIRNDVEDEEDMTACIHSFASSCLKIEFVDNQRLISSKQDNEDMTTYNDIEQSIHSLSIGPMSTTCNNTPDKEERSRIKHKPLTRGRQENVIRESIEDVGITTRNRRKALKFGKESMETATNPIVISSSHVNVDNEAIDKSTSLGQLCLDISDELIDDDGGQNQDREEQYTMVHYEGEEDDSVVQDNKQRPKVDIDRETQRIWKLIMTNEGSIERKQSIGYDEEMEDWWAEERNVFHARVQTFIERMHIVQGNKRFSKWKGSVVDSVIGVFLTQNVSDHLSSLSFMSLAAHFPTLSFDSTGDDNKMKGLNDTDMRHVTKKRIRKKIRRSLKRKKVNDMDWDELRKEVERNGTNNERDEDSMDAMNYEALAHASVEEISDVIKQRGMNNILAQRIKEFLNRLIQDHGRVDLEWLRYVPPNKAKEYLLSIQGLGIKSTECVRLLTLEHTAFPVDTNVARIVVRLGWVPLKHLPGSLELHLLQLYPTPESIQKYIWPRLCKLNARTLYELHYQMITFGKVICTKKKPSCNVCPMRSECRYFASSSASARLTLPPHVNIDGPVIQPLSISLIDDYTEVNCEPIIEEPSTPPQGEWSSALQNDIEDLVRNNLQEFHISEEIHTITMPTVRNQEYRDFGECDMTLVALSSQSFVQQPTPRMKYETRLRTEHQVYQLPDSHPLLEKMDKRESHDPSPYLLAIWPVGERPSGEPSQDCSSKNTVTVTGTFLIPCRTAMKGRFPLNGTYFQVNEVFADHASSIQPIDIPRECIWQLPRRIVYFGSSVSSIFRGLSIEQIQHCFWRGFVCVRGFDRERRAPRPLVARLHFKRTTKKN